MREVSGFKHPFPAAIQRAIVSWTGASHQMPMKFWLSGVNINKCGMRTNATGKSETKKKQKKQVTQSPETNSGNEQCNFKDARARRPPPAWRVAYNFDQIW